MSRSTAHGVAEGQPPSQLEASSSSTGSEGPLNGQGKRSKNVEAILYKLLQQLSPKERKCMVQEHFTEAQRLALERWILGQDEGDKWGGVLWGWGREVRWKWMKMIKYKPRHGWHHVIWYWGVILNLLLTTSWVSCQYRYTFAVEARLKILLYSRVIYKVLLSKKVTHTVSVPSNHHESHWVFPKIMVPPNHPV